MRRLFFAQIILIIFWSTSATAQWRGPLTDTTEAYALLNGKYKAGCVPDGDVPAIVKELQAIRKAVPAVAKVHDIGRYVPQQLLLSPTGLLSPSLTAEEKKSRIHQIALNPSATGIDMLNKLNRQFGVVKIVDEDLPGDWLLMFFDKPLDMECVAESYQALVGKQLQLNGMMGGGDQILRAQKHGEPVHYIFSIGTGDCPAGCINETVFYLNLYPTGAGYRIEKVDGPPAHHSLWGYPSRFPLRIFTDYDDLVKQTTSTEWSMRLHAVSALGNVYAFGGTGLGEDVIGELDEMSGERDPTVPKRVAVIVESIKKSRDQVKQLLEQSAASDPDDDVRRAAKAALRDEEQQRKEKQ